MNTFVLFAIGLIVSIVVSIALVVFTGNLDPITIIGPSAIIATIIFFITKKPIFFIYPLITFVAMCVFGIVMSILSSEDDE